MNTVALKNLIWRIYCFMWLYVCISSSALVSKAEISCLQVLLQMSYSYFKITFNPQSSPNHFTCPLNCHWEQRNAKICGNIYPFPCGVVWLNSAQRLHTNEQRQAWQVSLRVIVGAFGHMMCTGCECIITDVRDLFSDAVVLGFMDLSWIRSKWWSQWRSTDFVARCL